MRKILATILALCVFAFPAYAAKKQRAPHKHGKKLKSGQKWDLDVDRGKKQEEFYRALAWGIDKEKLDPIFDDSRLQLDPTITGFGISQTGKPCYYFDPCFGLLSEESLARGIAYWQMYRAYFDRSEKRSGVPAAADLAIFRVETKFGDHMGRRALPNTFFSFYAYSLSAKKRSWAVREMSYFLSRVLGEQDPFSFIGSPSGAFGICQFLPSSYVYFGEDGDDDGKIDLSNPADAIASTSRYLKENGWGNKPKSERFAFYAFNHSNAYVNAVYAYFKAIQKRIAQILQKEKS